MHARSNVLPTFLPNDVSDLRSAHTELPREFRLGGHTGCVFRADRDNVRFREFCSVRLASLRRAETPALYSISGVFLRCSCIEMFRPDAWRIVAMMENVHSYWDGTEVDLPRHMCSKPCSSIIANQTVTVFETTAGPCPTTLGLFNECPEPIFEATAVFAEAGAKYLMSPASTRAKCPTATGTDAINGRVPADFVANAVAILPAADEHFRGDRMKDRAARQAGACDRRGSHRNSSFRCRAPACVQQARGICYA